MLGDEAEYLPMNYGQEIVPTQIADNREVYILDFSFPRHVMEGLFALAKRVVWLDHHKTAFEMWCGKAPDLFFTLHKEHDESKTVVLDDCKSGAMLAWEYFHPSTKVPMLIQHIDNRDRWQFKLEGSKELHAVLASYQPWTFEMWEAHFLVGNVRFNALKDEGRAILRAHNQNVQSAAKQARPCAIRWFDGEVDGHPAVNVFSGLAANAPAFLASDLGHELANKSGTFGLVWSMAGDGQVHCSLRSNGDYDVSAIAKVFGCGGHRNAAGFSTDIDTLVSWLK
jgi:oligoribonuclease NrnB/cAMP/cGMP phosphodiesterase (DHH superfamily)